MICLPSPTYTIAGPRKMSAALPWLCGAMCVWMERFVADRAESLHVGQTSWRRHEEFYTHRMLGMCLQMKWVGGTCVRRRFRSLCDQFCVNTVVDLAEIMILNTCMKINDSFGFNLKVKRAYYGVVHERRPHERCEEHWRAVHVLQHSASIASATELKYGYMARHGGPLGGLLRGTSYHTHRYRAGR